MDEDLSCWEAAVCRLCVPRVVHRATAEPEADDLAAQGPILDEFVILVEAAMWGESLAYYAHRASTSRGPMRRGEGPDNVRQSKGRERGGVGCSANSQGSGRKIRGDWGLF